jgi:phospholipid/cholesterol/gamma-HCH transport system substrate-binding protein
MTRGVKVRLVAFVILSAVGITYITASYLGFVDRLLGRGITVQATLPTSGGLFEGSEVTYRGVKVGKVQTMTPTEEGVMLELALKDGTELPVDSPMFVHNLSAVGEQYLDFEPPDDSGPYADNGDTLVGSMESLPVDEADLLIELDAFVNSVDQPSLKVVIEELGLMFKDTGVPLQRLLDSGGKFIDEASASTDETIRLIETALPVLETQQDESENIRSFSRDLRLLTSSLRESDGDLRGVLDGAPGTAREVRALMEDLEPTLPVLLANAISVNQVMVSHLAGLEQLLVTFPRTIAGGFTGTTPDGFGHVNLQTDNSVPPCTEGYKPPSEWRRGNELSDAPIFPAQCTSGPPFVMRGPKYSPGMPANPSPPRAYSGSYDPATGLVDGAVDGKGNPVRLVEPGDLSILGDDSWKWMLVGPVAGS